MAPNHDATVFDKHTPSQLEETVRQRSDRPLLIFLDHGDKSDFNRRIRIDRRELVIGRDALCEIPIQDTRCSRRHARFLYTNFDQPNAEPRVLLTDLGSTNGMFVNGSRVTDHVLQDRDRILLGGTLLGYFVRDESELEADQRLYQMASCDALTRLRNRGVFDMELAREFDRSRRYGRELSLVLYDIDHFKRFNDTYGHQTGDYVLEQIGRLTMANIRTNDLGARYGGEEFAVVLPETSIEGALIQAERLRMEINRHPFAREGTVVSISVSLGLATVEEPMNAPADLVAAADRALYHAKATGRNRVCWTRGGELFNSDSRAALDETH